MTTATQPRIQPVDTLATLVDRYIDLWNDPDPTSRAAAIRALWAANGTQVLQAPEEVRQAARRFGFPSATFEVRGHEELDVRVACSYAEFVADGAHRFRLRDPGVRLGNVVKFSWDMVAAASGAVVGGGVQVLVLDDHDRVLIDHQFIDP